MQSDTKDGLIKKVSDLAREYISRELISEKIVIRYSIQTQMSYQLSADGTVFPNGVFGNGTGWRKGTRGTNASDKAPYGLNVFVAAFMRKDWRHKSGVIKTTIEQYWGSDNIVQTKEDAPNLHWIANLTTISNKDSHYSKPMEVCEIDYTEQSAKFFVDLISALCLLNERILPVIQNKESLLEFISSNRKLLQHRGQESE